MNEIQLLDVVALTDDSLTLYLQKGQVGTVVEILSPGVFLVEFSDHDGRTFAMQTLRAAQLLVLHYEPAVMA